jgi:hypothetical protein
MPWSKTLTLTGLALAFSLSALVALPGTQVKAADDDADQILKSMSDYLAAQKTISADYDSSVEVITPQLLKLQFNSSGTLLLKRPNELRATRTGGYADVEMFYNGKALTVYGKNLNGYAEVEAPGSIDDVIEKLREHGWALPGADLLLGNVYETLKAEVIESKHIGHAVINGIESEHLAFRSKDVDWQLWVERGDKPIPRKLVITSKAVGGAPQYTLVITGWKTDVTVEPSEFEFTPPEGATKLDTDALAKLDELPPETPAKGQ